MEIPPLDNCREDDIKMEAFLLYLLSKLNHMKLVRVVIILCVFTFVTNSNAQDAVKGSRNVTVVQNPIDAFSAMEIGESFEVRIVKGETPMVEIETDDNLHELIDIDVIGGTLYLQTIKEIKRSKRMNVRITFTDELKEIRVKEKAQVSGLTDLLFTSLLITTTNNGEFLGTVKAEYVKFINNDNGRAELNITADTTVFELNQKSKVEALVTSANFKADLLEDAKAKIEGDVKDFQLRADNGSRFTGENLTSQVCTVVIEGRAEASVKADNEINISAKGKSKLTIFDSPKFNIDAFEDEASLFKK